MIELTKGERRAVKDLIRIGILRRHAQWQSQLKELLDSPIDDGNEFDRSMEITKRARDFLKEAMRMEEYYRNSLLLGGIATLYHDGYLNDNDIASLPDELQDKIRPIFNF